MKMNLKIFGKHKKLKHYFINDKLPSNRLSENNVVIHLRQGDAMTTGRGNVINKHNEQLIKIMPLLTREYQIMFFIFIQIAMLLF